MVAQGRVSAGEAPPQLQPQCGWQEAEAPPPLARCAGGGRRGSARDCCSARWATSRAPPLPPRSVSGCRQKRLHVGEWGQGCQTHVCWLLNLMCVTFSSLTRPSACTPPHQGGSCWRGGS